MAFAALADLVEPVDRALIAELPDPQRRAIAIALLQQEPEHALGQRAVGAATLSVLRALAGQGPVLLALDDLQWVDAASAYALQFALRRTAELPVGVLGCVRIARDRPHCA